MSEETTRIPGPEATVPQEPSDEAGAQCWRTGGTAIVMAASVFAYGVMASGCAGL